MPNTDLEQMRADAFILKELVDRLGIERLKALESDR